MLDVGDNLAAIDRAGYQSIDTFSLPESDWWDPFYRDLSTELDEFRRRHAANGSEAFEGQGLIEHFEGEMDTLRESQGSYSYVFYIMRKPH
jgi:hypothetical protein